MRRSIDLSKARRQTDKMEMSELNVKKSDKCNRLITFTYKGKKSVCGYIG